jgi:hypothetical protein
VQIEVHDIQTRNAQQQTWPLGPSLKSKKIQWSGTQDTDLHIQTSLFMQIASSFKTRSLKKFSQINQNGIPKAGSRKFQLLKLLTSIHFLNYAVKLTIHVQLKVISYLSIE